MRKRLVTTITVYKQQNMKKTTIILLASLFMINITAQAQKVNGIRPETKFRVSSDKQKSEKNKGFCKKGDLDFESFVTKFGMPTEYTSLEESRAYDLIAGGRFFYAYYNKNGKEDSFAFQNEKLVSFSLETDKYLALDDMIPGGVKVGDPFTKISSVIPYSDIGKDPGGKRYTYMRRMKESDNTDPYFANILIIDSKNDYSTAIVEENGIIIGIQYDCMEFGDED